MAPRRRTARRAIVIAVSIVLASIVFLVVWVGVRSLVAASALREAESLSGRAQDALISGDTGSASASVDELVERTSEAASLTSDPVFRLAEAVPGLGPNLTALRQAAGAVDDLARGLAPLADIAGSLSAGSLAPVDGRVDIDKLAQIAPSLREAEGTISAVRDDLRLIDTTQTVDQIVDAVDRLTTATDDLSTKVTALSRASQLLPKMLGAEGDRRYLLIFQNNAEVRASGGIPGALALLSTSDGRFEMTTQSTAQAFPYFPAPVLPVDFETESLYSSEVGRRMQNVNLTPDFPASAAFAAEMWRQKFGDLVDGVIAVDPVLLGYLLKATGPVQLAVGGELTADNAVKFLLSDVYREFPDNASQDAVFASVAREVFGALSSGDVDIPALLAQLERGSGERRLLVWNARPDEQALVSGSDFSGELPDTNAGATVLGVFLNDASGAKLDYYLDATTDLAAGECDGRPQYRVDVTLSSSAPLDAVTTLSPTVLGPGVYGVPLGTIRTRVSVYGPVGSALASAKVDGQSTEVQSASHLDRPVGQVIVDLAPGESRTVTVEMDGAATPSSAVVLRMTPLLREFRGATMAFNCR